MDIIDNLIYASYLSGTQIGVPVIAPPGVSTPAPLAIPGQRVVSDFIDGFPALPIPSGPPFSYPNTDKIDFCSYEDPSSIEKAVYRHWYDISRRSNYDTLGLTQNGDPVSGVRIISFEVSSPYHLIYAYILENTRVLQIFERLIEKYVVDEDLGISTDPQVVNWIHTAENLFFRNTSSSSYNVRSIIRPSADATRRNAYWRLFGMDLAFGDINSENNSIPYHKAKYSNQQFIPLFEKYLSEVWQGYINARNSSGENRTDINVIVDLAVQLKDLLSARRGTGRYVNQNLSREEYYSVLITSWFTFNISLDTPLVKFLNCQSSSIGERLLKIGNKVGIPAHAKCQYLFEMAGSLSNILTSIELGGFLDNPLNVQTILSALNPPPPPPPLSPFPDFMRDFLIIINNWEKATGHRIKYPESNITGTIKVQQNGVKAQPTMN